MSCERVSDRMAAVAAGESWTAEEASHLAGCPACADEWRLFQRGRELGAGLAIDAERVAARVRERLATERPAEPLRRIRPIRWVAGLAAAAVLVLAVRAARVDRAPSGDTSPAAATALVLTELDDLSSSELDDLLGDLGDDEVPSPSMGISGFNDLSADELERVLRDWES